MNKILVISWFFPPINSSEGLVTYKLLKNSKYVFDVVMQDNCDSWSYGKNDILPGSDNINTIPVNAKCLDEFYDKAIKYFKSNSDKYDIVMTRSMPPESHKIGLEIKNLKPSIKWIASFGDPIANNPFSLKFKEPFSPYSLKNRYLRKMTLNEILSVKRVIKDILWNHRTKADRELFKKEQRFEKQILDTCDKIIFNSKYQMEYMTKGYPEKTKQKGIILYHSFDETLYPSERMPFDEKLITMSFVGHLDNIRTPKIFLEGLNLLKEEHPDLKNKLHIMFYGHMAIEDKAYILDNELYEIVHMKKAVSYLKSLEIMKNSDWLLHIDANLHGILKENIFFAAKIADYIGAGRPIFAVSMFDGAGADVIRDVPSVIASYTAEEIKNYLYLIVYENHMPIAVKNNENKYNAKNVAEKFDECIKEL